MKKRSLLALMAAAPLVLLSACGGSSGDGTATVRLVNASPGYASLDLYADDTQVASAIGFGSASEFASVSGGSVITELTVAGSTTNLLAQTRTLGDGTAYTIVAFGWEGALKSVIMTENQDAAAEGESKFSVLHTATDAGSVDIYLTDAADSLDSATPLVSAVPGGTQSGYISVDSATLRLRVTAAGSKTDVRLDVSGVTLTSGQVATMILTPGSSGVLVNGLLMTQGGEVVPFMNTKARVRAVAAVSDNAAVSVSANGAALLPAGSIAPTIGLYALVDAGAVAVTGTVNGVALAPTTQTVAAGADVTLLARGTPVSSAVSLITDDNRLPEDSAQAKLRLVNAVAGLTGGLTLTVDFSPIATDVLFPQASDFAEVTSTTSARVEVTSPLSVAPLFSVTDASLVSRGVYSVFMLGGAASPAGVLRRER